MGPSPVPSANVERKAKGRRRCAPAALPGPLPQTCSDMHVSDLCLIDARGPSEILLVMRSSGWGRPRSCPLTAVTSACSTLHDRRSRGCRSWASSRWFVLAIPRVQNAQNPGSAVHGSSTGVRYKMKETQPSRRRPSAPRRGGHRWRSCSRRGW